jgi:hypothetical protein
MSYYGEMSLCRGKGGPLPKGRLLMGRVVSEGRTEVGLVGRDPGRVKVSLLWEGM